MMMKNLPADTLDPGATHDNQIYQNTELYNHHESYFGQTYFVVGDCAFENTKCMVTLYKKLSGQVTKKVSTHVYVRAYNWNVKSSLSFFKFDANVI
jgi:hypothetical protein